MKDKNIQNDFSTITSTNTKPEKINLQNFRKTKNERNTISRIIYDKS